MCDFSTYILGHMDYILPVFFHFSYSLGILYQGEFECFSSCVRVCDVV